MADHPSSTATTVATWVYLLHTAGIDAGQEDIRDQCEAVDDAAGAEDGDEAGMALVHAVERQLEGDSPAAVRIATKALFGRRLAEGLGEGDRPARTARIRRYQFAVGLPWLARIWERHSDSVEPRWVIVERVTDEVHMMDPNPWDDIDEERHMPVGDFQVLWELDGCTAMHVDGA